MDNVEDDYKGWLDGVQATVQDAWQERGYFKVEVHAQSRELSSSPEVKNVALTFQIDEGEQYRMGQIKFLNGKQFEPTQLRPLFPISEGEIFNTHKIGEGLEKARTAYNEIGFINFIVVPEIVVDGQSLRVSLNLDLDEGKQFRLAAVQVVGSDQKRLEPLLRQYLLLPGEIFNPRHVAEFAADSNLRPEDDVYRVINEENATVCLVIHAPDHP